jgi:hypothetical protein
MSDRQRGNKLRGSVVVAALITATLGLGAVKRLAVGPRKALAQSGGGLKGDYFDNMDLTNLQLTRTDANVAFNWGNGSPDPKIGPDTFSVRWTGTVTPSYSETYTFYEYSYDGARLWVNGQLLIDDWAFDEGEESATITLTAGHAYDIKLEYYENSGAAVMQLSWSSPHTPKAFIPQSALNPPGNTPPPAALLFREGFEDQTPTCWQTPGARCGDFTVDKSAASISTSFARTGSKSLLVSYSANEQEGGGILDPQAEHVFYRFYDYYDANFDFARGMKIARLSAADPVAQVNQYDHILVSRFLPNNASACGKQDNGEFLVARNSGANFAFWNQSYPRSTWISVEWEMKLNHPGQSDGEVRVYIDGTQVMEVTGRGDLRDATDNLPINTLLVGGWYSNSDSNASCTAPSIIPAKRYIDDVIVATQYIGPEPRTTAGGSGQRLVSFTTPKPGTTQIDYGADASYGQSTSLDSANVTAHSQTITGLTPGATYHYRVRSTWTNGYAYASPDYTFVAN